MPWKPQLRAAVDLHALALDEQQEFLLSCLDGSVETEELALLTGLAPDRVQSTLRELVALGAVEAEESVESGDPDDRLSHRALFEQRLHHRSTDERAALCRQAEEPELSAYCFDPMPQVIHELLQNPRFGLPQARLVATHHRTAAGLELVGANPAFLADQGVRRALLQNPILPASIYRRAWGPRRLQDQYLVAASHEVPEQTKAMAREVLRTSFNQRTADEKAELILKTEGRCLVLLTGLAIDGHTTQILCRRTIISTLFIQNIARWSAAPPQLIAHLLRQEMVRRNVQLRQMLERHPNANA